MSAGINDLILVQPYIPHPFPHVILSVLFSKERAKPFARDMKTQSQEQTSSQVSRQVQIQTHTADRDHRRPQEGEVKNSNWGLSRLNYTKHKPFNLIFLGVTPMHYW